MARIMFATDAWSVQAGVTDESGGVGAAAANMLDIDPVLAWETDDSGNGEFTLVGGAGPADTFILPFCGLTTSASVWRIIAASNEANLVTSPLIDTGTIPLWPHSGLEGIEFIHGIYKHPNVETIGAVRIIVADPSAPNGSFTIGRCMISEAFIPTVNYSHAAGYGWGHRDTSRIERSPNGRVTLLRDPKVFSAQVSMDFQTLADAHEFTRLAYYYGSSYPVFVAFDVEDTTFGHDRMGHVLLKWSDPPIISSSVVNRFRVVLGMEEMGV